MSRVPTALLALRLSIFLVMLMWTLDKFVNPKHAAAVYEHYYGIAAPSAAAMRSLGAIELTLLIGFVLGYRKRLTYGAVLALHAVSTFSSYAAYLNPWESSHLLFFAAWPMLAGCFALYLLRDHDIRLTL
ncbi:MAG: hypothetical protein OEM49_05120 [Myxococcales bacterium]|nr:hypothetical protein [Myxococcales bacterium]MDH5306334.1 hypothetical protein [Myxococcales bacterium]MDH5565617.1 hypothetical protein [Myxococcales bacterium]